MLRRSLAAFCFGFMVTMTTQTNALNYSVAPSVSAYITADNDYGFGFGTSSGIDPASWRGGVSNCVSSDIFTCGPGPETYDNVPVVNPDGYLYIVAYRDDLHTQGLMARFRPTGGNQSQGAYTYGGFPGAPWQVFATGLPLTRVGCTVTFPDQNTINEQIQLANTNNGLAGGSIGWVDDQGSNPFGVGYLATGEPNDDAPNVPCPGNGRNVFPQVCESVMGRYAQWIWYGDANGNDFCNPGPDGGWLIFRAPASLFNRIYVGVPASNHTGILALALIVLALGGWLSRRQTAGDQGRA